jgi:uncharacterized RDD family membrane protein YckC
MEPALQSGVRWSGMTVRDLHLIRTPENVSFEFELAGVASRAAAWLIDVTVMMGLTFGAILIATLFGSVFAGLGMMMYFVLAFAVQWGYGAVQEWAFDGQTLGKRVAAIRTISVAGTPVTFVQAAVRNLVRVVDLLPALYGVGAVSALLDDKGRRLGDIAAGTVVVRARRSPRPSAVMAPVDRYNSFLHDEGVAHAIRRITPPERDAMIDLAVRRETLPLPVRYALFAKLAAHLEQRLGVERPDFVSEERFVLNLASIALSTRQDARLTRGTP